MSSNVQNKTDYSKDPRWQEVAAEKAKGDALDKTSWVHTDKAIDAIADKHFGTVRSETVKAIEASAQARTHYNKSNDIALQIARDASKENCIIC